MNTFSHIIMGRLLCRYVKENHGILLDRAAFVAGNYLPDYQITLITRPHYIQHCLTYVQDEVAALSALPQRSAGIDKQFSRRLGILCHYYADFFCFAHSEFFDQNLACHVRYEAALHRFLTSKLDTLQHMQHAAREHLSDGPGGVNDTIGRYHEAYLSLFPSFENDVLCALQACAHTVVSLSRCAQRLGAQERRESQAVPAAV